MNIFAFAFLATAAIQPSASFEAPSSGEHPTQPVSSSPLVASLVSDIPTNGFCHVKKIKIQQTSSEILNLFEVVAISRISNRNVASLDSGASATQSSTHKSNDAKFGAALAIDGVTPGAVGGSFMHTDASDAQAYWEVTLAAVEDIESVTIYNRWVGYVFV